MGRAAVDPMRPLRPHAPVGRTERRRRLTHTLPNGQHSALHVQACTHGIGSSADRRSAATVEHQLAISAMRRVIMSLSAMMVACGLTALGLGKMLASTT